VQLSDIKLTKRGFGIITYGLIVVVFIGILLPYSVFVTIETQTTIPKVNLTFEKVTIKYTDDVPTNVIITVNIKNPSQYISITIDKIVSNGAKLDGRDLGIAFKDQWRLNSPISANSNRSVSVSVKICPEFVCPKLYNEIYSFFPKNNQTSSEWKFLDFEYRFDISYLKGVRKQFSYEHQGHIIRIIEKNM
jgi:hypothetical protein